MPGGERETLLALQQALPEEQFQAFKYLLGEQLPLGQLQAAARPEICALLLQRFPGRALHLSADLLRRIARHDLIRLYRLPGGEEEEEKTLEEKGEGGECCASPGGMAAGRPAVTSAVTSAARRPPRLTEKELLAVAQKLGREWQEVGIACLGLERSRLDQIREENAGSGVMQRFEMLREWWRRERGEATAPRLRALLAPACPDPGVLDLLGGGD